MSAFGADVVCVKGPDGIFSSDFYVKYNIPSVDLALLSLVGLNPNSLEKSSCTAYGGLNDPGNTKKQCENDSQVPNDNSRSNHIANLMSKRESAEWIELYCNDSLCEEIHAIVGHHHELCFIIADGTNNASYYLSKSLTTQQLLSMPLIPGRNTIRCIHSKTNIETEFYMWNYSSSDYVLIMDIDGTITRSDVRGYFETAIAGIYTYIHEGIIPFLCTVQDNFKCQILYLTSRPISHLIPTRNLLEGAKDDRHGLHLPNGPLFMNRDATLTAVYNEVIAKKAAEYKSGVLLKINKLFQLAGRKSKSHPLFFGIGNKDTDAQAYSIAGIPHSNILLIDTSSKLQIYSQLFSSKGESSWAMFSSSSSSKEKGKDSVSVTTVDGALISSGKLSSSSSSNKNKVKNIKFSSYKDMALIEYFEQSLNKSKSQSYFQAEDSDESTNVV